MKTKLLYLLLLGIMTSSCATIFTGSRKKITLNSNIENAKKIDVDGNVYKNVSFPFIVRVRRGFDQSIIKAQADGYEPSLLYINKNFNAVSIINLGNIIGWGIDAATGAMMKPEFNIYDLEFISNPPKETPKQ